jgi:hypothetical protein
MAALTFTLSYTSMSVSHSTVNALSKRSRGPIEAVAPLLQAIGHRRGTVDPLPEIEALPIAPAIGGLTGALSGELFIGTTQHDGAYRVFWAVVLKRDDISGSKMSESDLLDEPRPLFGGSPYFVRFDTGNLDVEIALGIPARKLAHGRRPVGLGC